MEEEEEEKRKKNKKEEDDDEDDQDAYVAGHGDGVSPHKDDQDDTQEKKCHVCSFRYI